MTGNSTRPDAHPVLVANEIEGEDQKQVVVLRPTHF